eukprot:COSAG04_NODE_1671_length_5986_cov_2.949720_1_plen_111_part_00
MVISLVSQLVNFGVAAVCLLNKEARFEQGLSGISDEVALFAAVVGFVLVAVQVAPIVHSYITQDKDKPADTAESVPTEKQLDDLVAEVGGGAAGGAVEVVESPLGDAQDL